MIKKAKVVGSKILIVDDHPQTATQISTILMLGGFNILEADNKKDALSLCEKEKPVLIIVNTETVDINCFKEHNLILTGFESDLEKYRKYKEVLGFVEKPIDKEELIRTVENALLKINKN
jgi:response regulator RpfG family c-di-GMP phosphodiesterase